MLDSTSVVSTTPLVPTREGISVKKFLLNLPLWRFSMESPATVDLSTDTGIVRLLIVAQGWSMDWPVPEAELKEAVTDLREGRLQVAQVVLVDYAWKVQARARVQRVVKKIGFRPARRGVFWVKASFKSAVRCFPPKEQILLKQRSAKAPI